MKQYRFYLDNTLLADDPKGWSEGKLVLKRNEDFNALFYEYATDLVFWGDGYSYLMTQFAGNICAEVNLRIERSCDPLENYDNIFEGIIKLRDAQVDERRCTITCNAEDNTLSDKILKFADSEFDITANKGFSGVPLTPTPTRSIKIFSQTGVLAYNRVGYYVFDALEFFFSAITGGQSVLTSDYFNVTDPQRLKFDITFTSPVELTYVGNNMNINVTNYLGESYTITVAINAVAAVTLQSISDAFRVTSGGTSLEDYYANDYRNVAKATNDGVSVISIENDLPFTIDSITYGPFNIPNNYTVTETQALVDGMRKLTLCTGGQLRNSATAKTPFISLKTLFSELHKQCDLGMSVKNVGGVIQIRIEPIQYFFNATNSITLDNVPEFRYTISDRFTKDIAGVGDGKRNDNLRSFAMDSYDWYTGGNCYLNKISLKNQWIVDWNQINTQMLSGPGGSDTLDDAIFLIECGDSSTGADADSIIFEDFPSGGVSGNAMNAHLTNYWKLRRWLFSFTSNPTFGGKTITNDALAVKRGYEFTHPLSFSDFKLIRANPEYSIIFRKSNNSIDNHFGWIDEISYDNKTGKADFKLIAT